MALFHYTSVQAIQSILTTRKIRLTDIRFLNDSHELTDGLKLFAEVISNYEYSSKFEERAIETIKQSFFRSQVNNTNLDPLYVFSLTQAKNQLSQWRAYGSYAIEFHEKHFFDMEWAKSYTPCIYKNDTKYNHAKSLIDWAVERLTDDFKNYTNISFLGVDAVNTLYNKAALFKNDGFHEEEECRIIISESDECQLKFRDRGSLLVPFIELDIPLDCIRTIHLGPMPDQDLAYESMCQFAAQVEKDWQVETGNIEYWLRVEKSSIPYRGV